MNKLLLVTKDYMAASRLYTPLSGHFELMTCLAIPSDIQVHISLFDPDALVYVLTGMDATGYSELRALAADHKGLPLLAYGSEADCKICRDTSGMFIREYLDSSAPTSKITELLNSAINHSIFDRMDSDLNNAAASLKGDDTSALSRQVDALLADAPLNVPEGRDVNGLPVAPDGQTHILIVDDDVQMLKTLKMYLEDSFAVATAPNGILAHRYLNSHPVQLVLLDYMMPRMNGPELLERIRMNPHTSSVPVIFLTGAAERSQISEALKYNPQGYMLKPCDRDKLLETIRKVLTEGK